MGFQPVGTYTAVGFKCGRWHDVGWYQLALQSQVAKPAEPRSIHEVRADAEWDAALASGLALLRS